MSCLHRQVLGKAALQAAAGIPLGWAMAFAGRQVLDSNILSTEKTDKVLQQAGMETGAKKPGPMTGIAGSLALLGLVLAAAGLFGVTSYAKKLFA